MSIKHFPSGENAKEKKHGKRKEQHARKKAGAHS